MNPESEAPPPLPPENDVPPRLEHSRRRLFAGMVLGNVVGGMLCGLVVWLSQDYPERSSLVLPSFVLISMCIGLVAAWVWSPLQLRFGATMSQTVGCTLVTLLVSFLCFGEGVICLIIVSPLLYIGILAGALVGRMFFQRDRSKLGIWFAPVLAIAILVEPASRHPHTSVVVDELRIAAPPAAVWPHVLAFSSIPERPSFWLFELGLPYPTETTNGGNFVGADRACVFSGGAVFKERIVEFNPNRQLTFDMVESPRDPELIGHLDAERGQFELRDNGDGTTTLIGRTWYTLHIRPTSYFDWWTHQVFSEVHLRVMRNVKRLAEGTQ